MLNFTAIINRNNHNNFAVYGKSVKRILQFQMENDFARFAQNEENK